MISSNSAGITFAAPTCAICQSTEGEREQWHSSWNYKAHKECLTAIEPIQRPLILRINDIFKEREDSAAFAFRLSLDAIKDKCGDATFFQLLQTPEGKDRLQKLFDTVGVQAAEKHAKALKARI